MRSRIALPAEGLAGRDGENLEQRNEENQMLLFWTFQLLWIIVDVPCYVA